MSDPRPFTPEERAQLWREKSGDCEFCPCCWDEMRRWEATVRALEAERDAFQEAAWIAEGMVRAALERRADGT